MASSDDFIRPCFTLIREPDGSLVVRLKGDIDVTNASEIEALLRQATAEEPKTLVADLQAVTFLDTAGVRLLLLAHRWQQGGGNHLKVVLAQGEGVVRHVLKIIVPPYSQKAILIDLTQGITTKGPPVPVLNKKAPDNISKQSFQGMVYFNKNNGQLTEIQASHQLYFPLFLKGPEPVPGECKLQYQLTLQP